MLLYYTGHKRTFDQYYSVTYPTGRDESCVTLDSWVGATLYVQALSVHKNQN